jgi:hypothetical protein
MDDDDSEGTLLDEIDPAGKLLLVSGGQSQEGRICLLTCV